MSNQVFSFGFNGIKNYELPTFSGFRSVSEAEAAMNRLIVHDFNSSNEIIYFSFGSGNTHLYLHGQFKPAEANLAVREENLGGHLENIENSSQSEQDAIREEDNQLAEAINVLRAVSLLRD